MTKPSKKAKALPPPKRRFSEEFKIEAVRLLRERQRHGGTAAQLARELDVGPGLLSVWVRQLNEAGADDGGETAGGETLEQEVRRLRRENAILRQEREFAKKAAAFFAKESL